MLLIINNFTETFCDVDDWIFHSLSLCVSPFSVYYLCCFVTVCTVKRCRRGVMSRSYFTSCPSENTLFRQTRTRKKRTAKSCKHLAFVRPPPRNLGVRGASIVRCGLSCLVDLNSDLYRLCSSLHGPDTFWARELSWIDKETTTTTTNFSGALAILSFFLLAAPGKFFSWVTNPTCGDKFHLKN